MTNNFPGRSTPKPGRALLAIAFLIATVWWSHAAIPPLERILPADTLFVVAVPDMDKMRELKKTTAQTRFWNDPAMKPFTDHFIASWNSEFVAPLERELGIHLDDYTSLPQGLVAFAITRSGGANNSPGMIFLVDTKAKSAQLRTNLTNLQKKWVASGKSMQTQKLHGVDFMSLTVSSADMPKTIKKYFSNPTPTLPTDDPTKTTETKGTVVIGQFESLLIIGNTPEAVDSVASRLAGSSAPVLGDVDSFAADQGSILRDAPLFAWANAHAFIQMALEKPDGAPDAPPMGPMGMFKLDKVIAATGVNGLKSICVTYQNVGDGLLTQVFFRAPESTRQGLFKLVSGDSRDASPPPFVPDNVIKFQRWRIDGQKTWAALEKMLSDISPSALNGINYLIESANSALREKDPDFDLRKQLIGNLGNDFITYQKAPHDMTMAALNSPPQLYLIGTSNPDQMVGALQNLFRWISPSGATDREFLGRKIYTVTIPSNPMGGMPEPGQPLARKMNLAASSGYIALSSDPSMVEEYLRSAQDPPKPLRDTPGLNDAAQKVSGMGTGWFGYENQNENMRVLFDAMRKSSATNMNTNPFLASFSGIPGLGNSLQSWLDFSLLPPFEKVSKYFSYSVFASSTTADGLNFKVFAPLPPGLKN